MSFLDRGGGVGWGEGPQEGILELNDGGNVTVDIASE